jgi:hypothetical protein
VANAYFRLTDTSAGTWTYETAAEAGGPWSPELQHGGPPNALLVHVAEELAAASTGRDDLVAMRTAAEFVGPVPVAPVTITAAVVRAARSAVLVDAALDADGRPCLHARVWLVRRGSTAEVAGAAAAADAPPEDAPGLDVDFPYARTIEWRMVRGSMRQPGPAAGWARPRLPVVAGTALSGLQRAALIGDSASGLSSVLSWDVWSFLNVDLDVHLARPLDGEWLLMEAETRLGPEGTGLTRSTLSDAAGPVGATLQTLVVEPRRR